MRVHKEDVFMAAKSNTSRGLILLSLMLAGACLAKPPADDLSALSPADLEQRLVDIDHELKTLANYSIRGGAGTIGYRSDHHKTAHHLEWVQIDFETAHPLDEVALVPVVRRDPQTAFSSDGFPEHIRLIAGMANDVKGEVIAEYTQNQIAPSRIAPLLIPCRGITASWIRIETERLSRRTFDGRYALHLSEIMAFSGTKNVALHQSVTSKSSWGRSLAWGPHCVVDGFVPYLMDAASEEKSVAFMSRIKNKNPTSLTIDLGEKKPVSGLNLHAIDNSHVLPQAHPSGLGIPHGMRLEGANRPDFSDSEILLYMHLDTIYDMAPVMSWAFPENTHRYFRLSVTAPSEDLMVDPGSSRFGFAEIELLSNGNNIALGKPVSSNIKTTHPNRPLSALTDGHNMFGPILPIRNWMQQLARRHDLEAARPLVVAELSRRYIRQKKNLQRLIWLASLLAGGIGFTVLIEQLIRQRQIAQIKERFAADLHDELGANLHTIGLLSDLAEESKNDPDELTMLHQRIRNVTTQTGTAMRHCTSMTEANGLYTGLESDMQRAADRIMAKLDHELSISGAEYLSQLKPRTRVDLFLFYKETLVNISRHSGATRFSTRLEADHKEIRLSISDNGCGLPEGVPSSLKRRARLLGAKVTAETPTSGGAGIHLTLKTRPWGRQK
jgi:signal transduction histidine kinase